jgi:hypothetical protein
MEYSTGVQKFALSNPDLFEAFRDYWHHYRSEVTSYNSLKATNHEYNKGMSFAEKESKLNAALRKEVIKRSGINYASESNINDWFFHPLAQHETFAIVGAMIDMILPETIVSSTSAFAEISQGGFGDSFNFEVKPSDLFVVSKAGKNQRHAEVHKQYSGMVTILPEFREITVGVNMYKVLCGKESLAEFTAKAVRSLETRMTLDIYNAFVTATTNFPSTATTGLQVSGYSQASLLRLCQQVEAWNFGAKPIVVGTSLALINVLPDDANYRFSLEDQYVKLGYINTISGYDLMILPQVADFTTQWALAISNSYIWVISPSSQKLIKVCLEGTTISFTDGVFDNPNLTQKSTLKKSYGVGFASNAVAAIMSVP